jgi:hypothetical protein
LTLAPSAARGTIETMFDQTRGTDVMALRRIALLVMRARDDASPGAIHDGLAKITLVIERMKRSVAVGSPPEGNDVVSLYTLVKRLPKTACDAHSASDIVRWSAINELRDLAASMHSS